MLSLKSPISLVGIQGISNYLKLFFTLTLFFIFNIAILNALSNSTISYYNTKGMIIYTMLTLSY